MSKTQQEGLKRLRKRVKDHEVIIVPTDKSGKFCLTTPDAYVEMRLSIQQVIKRSHKRRLGTPRNY